MNKRIMGAALGALLTTGALLGSATAVAWQAGDIILRAGAAGVLPDSDSERITPLSADARVEAQDAWSLGLTMTYMATKNIGVGVLAAWPFEHDIDGAGDISALNTVATTKHLPPSVTLQYHFDTGSKFHPYIGAGLNYTYFFDEDTKNTLATISPEIDLDDSFGLAGEVGVDYELSNNWVVSGQVWYLDIDTRAKIKGVAGSYDVDIDPWVVMVGVGKKF